MYLGRLFVLSGPSGAGKGTICKELLKNSERMVLSISMTTRSPREGEVDGINYHFVTKEQFEENIKEDGFLEYAQVFENYYGTPKQLVIDTLKSGKDVLLEIDTQGAMQIKKAYPDAIFIFILPPSMKELRRRITNRGTEDASTMELRLREALTEIEYVEKYDYAVVNDQLIVAVDRVKTIVRAEHLKVAEGIKDIINRYKEDENAIPID